jgi:hypothetical protein
VTSRGWYRIDPGKCLHPDVTGQPKQVYSFAEAVDGENRAIKYRDKPLNWGGRRSCARARASSKSPNRAIAAPAGLRRSALRRST